MSGLDLFDGALRGRDAFVVRAVGHLAGEVGVRQFLDLGSGISDGPLLHAVAQRIIPTARVLYVVDDPAFPAQLDDRPAGSGHVRGCRADPTDPAAVLEHATGVLDLAEPVAVMLSGVLHHMDDQTAGGLVSALVDAVVTESHVALSHLACDIQPGEMDALRHQLDDTTAETWVFRSRDHVRNFLAGLDVVAPGVVPVDEWRPSVVPVPSRPTVGCTSPVWAGVGRKP